MKLQPIPPNYTDEDGDVINLHRISNRYLLEKIKEINQAKIDALITRTEPSEIVGWLDAFMHEAEKRNIVKFL